MRPPSPQGRRTQQQRRAHTEQALLDSAARLFAQQGVDHTSLADIGEAAGYSRGLVNFHFGSRAVLLERLAMRVQDEFFSQLATLEGDEPAALSAMADSYMAMLSQSEESTRAFFIMSGAALPAKSELRFVFVNGDKIFRDRVQSVLVAGQRNKTINTDIDAAGGAAAYVGMLRGIAVQHLMDLDGFDLAAARTACGEFIRVAFLPRGDS